MVLAEGLGPGEAVLRAGIFRRHARAPRDLGAAVGGVAANGAWRWAMAALAVWRRDWVLARADRRPTNDHRRPTNDERRTTNDGQIDPKCKMAVCAVGPVYSIDINAVSCRITLPSADLPGAAAIYGLDGDADCRSSIAD